MSRGQRIAVDCDGVLHLYSLGWHDGTMYDEPVPGAREAVQKLINKGYEVYVLTARHNRPEVEEWLEKHGFPKMRVSRVKLPAIAYIDDRGIRFTNWADISKYF